MMRLAREEAEEAEKEEMWELKGAMYAGFSIAIFSFCFYYFCVRRKQLRNQQYVHV